MLTPAQHGPAGRTVRIAPGWETLSEYPAGMAGGPARWPAGSGQIANR